MGVYTLIHYFFLFLLPFWAVLSSLDDQRDLIRSPTIYDSSCLSPFSIGYQSCLHSGIFIGPRARLSPRNRSRWNDH
jgi:hypothetical protein